MDTSGERRGGGARPRSRFADAVQFACRNHYGRVLLHGATLSNAVHALRAAGRAWRECIERIDRDLAGEALAANDFRVLTDLRARLLEQIDDAEDAADCFEDAAEVAVVLSEAQRSSFRAPPRRDVAEPYAGRLTERGTLDTTA